MGKSTQTLVAMATKNHGGPMVVLPLC